MKTQGVAGMTKLKSIISKRSQPQKMATIESISIPTNLLGLPSKGTFDASSPITPKSKRSSWFAKKKKSLNEPAGRKSRSKNRLRASFASKNMKTSEFGQITPSKSRTPKS